MEAAIPSVSGISSDLLFIDDPDDAQPSSKNTTCENDQGIKETQNSLHKLCEPQIANMSHTDNDNIYSDIPEVNIPGNFQFMDDMDSEQIYSRDIRYSFDNVSDNCSKTETDNLIFQLTEPQMIFKIPSIYLPSNLEYIDENEPSDSHRRRVHRGDKTHSSLRIPKRHSTKRRLCRHHSDSEAKSAETTLSKPKHHRTRSKRVKRSVSAIETNKNTYKPSVRRSFSERSGMIVAGKHLMPPCAKTRPHSHCENGSSRCSSTKTLSTNVSISEMVAVEFGYKDIPGLTPKEARRKRVVCTVMVVSVTILVVSVLLVAVTLLLSPAVDALCKFIYLPIYFYISFTLCRQIPN